MTEIGALIEEAMRRKAEEVGEYSYRDLGRDSDVHFTLAQKVVKGKRKASREMIRHWSRALHPYLPLDAALVAAGYTPESNTILESVRDAVGLTRKAWRSRLPIQHAPSDPQHPGGHNDAQEKGDDEPEV